VTDETKPVLPEEEAVLRVSASSNPQSVASAIAHAIYEKHEVKHPK